MSESMVKCDSCGTENPASLEKCQNCGKALTKSAAAENAKPRSSRSAAATGKKPAAEIPTPPASVPPLSPEPPASTGGGSGKTDLTWMWIGLGLLALFGLIVLMAVLFGNSRNKTASSATDAGTSPTETKIVIKTQTSKKDGMEMVYIPAGEFIMGAKEDTGNKDERPQHTVYLDAYWIDQTEVTNAMYEKCVNAGVCSSPKNESSNTWKKYFGNDNHAANPVIYVTWYQAQKYCEWVGRELPTEAQWEKAARGTDGQTYPWGNDDPNEKLANYNDKISDTTAVGSYPDGASPYGALDMAGNVWEWTNDFYGDQYYDSSPLKNPTGPDSGEYHVIRGGSWFNLKADIRTTIRSALNAGRAYYDTGFRCASSD